MSESGFRRLPRLNTSTIVHKPLSLLERNINREIQICALLAFVLQLALCYGFDAVDQRHVRL